MWGHRAGAGQSRGGHSRTLSQRPLLPLYSKESAQRSPKEGLSSLHPQSPNHPKTSPYSSPPASHEAEVILPVLEPVANIPRPFCVCLSSCCPWPFPFVSESPPCSLTLGNCQPPPFQPWRPPYLKLSFTVKLTSWGPGSSRVFSNLITQVSPGLLHLLCPQLQPDPGPWSLLSSCCVCGGGGHSPWGFH